MYNNWLVVFISELNLGLEGKCLLIPRSRGDFVQSTLAHSKYVVLAEVLL